MELLRWIEISIIFIGCIACPLHFVIGCFRFIFAAKGINFFYSLRWAVIVVAVTTHHGYVFYGWS